MLIAVQVCLVHLISYCQGFDTLLEGDMAVPRTSGGTKVRDSFVLDSGHLWSEGVVPYLFETLPLVGGGEEPILSDHHKDMIKAAIAHISEKVPCIQFREISKKYNGAHLIFTTSGDSNYSPNGCWAYAGRQGAQGGKDGQTVNLGASYDGCFNPGTITHEILHSLGATHEQNRADRDDFVEIVYDEIMEKKNFEKKGSLFSSFNTHYDFSSVMHYGAYDSSKSGKRTIIPLVENLRIDPASEKQGMSPIDTMELARVYDNQTTSNCYHKAVIEEYAEELEKLLKRQNGQLCEKGLYITEVSTKTSPRKNKQTEDTVHITICDVSERCCSTSLDTPEVDDHKQGRTDHFSGKSVLGQCSNFKVREGKLKVTLDTSDTDGWYVDWAKIELAGGTGGISFSCTFSDWLDEQVGFSRSMTVICYRTDSCVTPSLHNGHVVSEGDESVWSGVFKCKTGFTLVGPSKLKCRNGIWSSNMPVCRVEGCDEVYTSPGIPGHPGGVGCKQLQGGIGAASLKMEDCKAKCAANPDCTHWKAFQTGSPWCWNLGGRGCLKAQPSSWGSRKTFYGFSKC